jgi:hypothetical protein
MLTIGMPVWNRAYCIQETLESVKNQTNPKKQIKIVEATRHMKGAKTVQDLVMKVVMFSPTSQRSSTILQIIFKQVIQFAR